MSTSGRRALLVLAVAAVGAAPPALALQERPAPPPDAPEAEPLPLERVDLLLRRAQSNLALHGLSLEPAHLARAEVDLREATRRLPADAGPERTFDAWFSLAFVLVRNGEAVEGKLPEALDREVGAAIAKASAVNPRFPGLWILDGMRLENLGNAAAAVERITEGLDLLEGMRDSLAPTLTYQLRLFALRSRGRALLSPDLGRQYLAAKDFEEAVALATEALKDPAVPRPSRLRRDVLTHLVAAYVELDYFDKAERILEELRSLDPGNYIHPFNLALVKARRQRYSEALALYRKAAALRPDEPVSHLKVAYILLVFPQPGEKPDTKEALREATVYLRLRGGIPDAEYCSLRGEIAFLSGDAAAAEDWFRQALDLVPDCRMALNRLIQIASRRQAPADPAEREARRKETLEFRRRLMEEEEKRRKGRGGMEGRKTSLTFC
jgi:tetratricopeptide (TPR) repeat protein